MNSEYFVNLAILSYPKMTKCKSGHFSESKTSQTKKTLTIWAITAPFHTQDIGCYELNELGLSNSGGQSHRGSASYTPCSTLFPCAPYKCKGGLEHNN
eukprot:sb/3478919/